MKTLYWHIYRPRRLLRRETVWMLFDFDPPPSDQIRPTGELAHVRRLSSGWEGFVKPIGSAPSYAVRANSANGVRRAIERYVDKKSIGMFDEDVVKFVQPQID